MAQAPGVFAHLLEDLHNSLQPGADPFRPFRGPILVTLRAIGAEASVHHRAHGFLQMIFARVHLRPGRALVTRVTMTCDGPCDDTVEIMGRGWCGRRAGSVGIRAGGMSVGMERV